MQVPCQHAHLFVIRLHNESYEKYNPPEHVTLFHSHNSYGISYCDNTAQQVLASARTSFKVYAWAGKKYIMMSVSMMYLKTPAVVTEGGMRNKTQKRAKLIFVGDELSESSVSLSIDGLDYAWPIQDLKGSSAKTLTIDVFKKTYCLNVAELLAEADKVLTEREIAGKRNMLRFAPTPDDDSDPPKKEENYFASVKNMHVKVSRAQWEAIGRILNGKD